jgi:hypothetical protein
MNVTTTVSTSSGIAWNGPVCQTCCKPYLGTHQCSPMDLMDRADELMRLARLAFERMNPQPTVGPEDRTSGCPCRPENGGSGVCGCTLGGPQITC